MNRRVTVPLALLTVAALGIVPAQAAKPKPKPKPIKGSYSVTLVPDVSPNVVAQTGATPVCGTLAPSMDKHPFTVPAAGTLSVVLDSPDPTKGAYPAGPDWDLWLLDAAGDTIDGSHGGTAHEQVATKFKKKTPLTILVCNINGEPTGNISYTFTYK